MRVLAWRVGARVGVSSATVGVSSIAIVSDDDVGDTVGKTVEVSVAAGVAVRVGVAVETSVAVG